MGFDKYMGKERRKEYYDCRAFDPACRNNGACKVCENNRLYKHKKRIKSCEQQLEDFLKEVIDYA